jgi:hypothetical protein
MLATRKKFDGLGLDSVPRDFSSCFFAAIRTYLEKTKFKDASKVYVIEVGICEERSTVGVPHWRSKR